VAKRTNFMGSSLLTKCSLTKKFTIFLFFAFLVIPWNLYSIQSILLKTGKTVRGTIVEQTDTILTLDLGNGKKELIEKTKILKVVYKELTLEEEKKIRIIEDNKLLATKSNQTIDQLQLKENPLVKADKKSLVNDATKNDTFIILFTVEGKNCNPYKSQTEWFWLYGNLHLSEVNWNEILPEDIKPIHIRWESTTEDTIISFVLGTLTSITRRSVSVDICELDKK
jgi:hypothetical protein